MRRALYLGLPLLAQLGMGDPVQAQPAPAAAQPSQVRAESDVEEKRRRLEDLTAGKARLPARGGPGAEPGSTNDPMLPTAPKPTTLEGETKEKYEEALREYYEYHISGLRHRSRVFQWQLFSSRLIFVMVALLVLAGIYFAAVQFHIGLHGSRAAEGQGEAVTEFSASMEGFKVSSPVVGVVILVISLAFFYFYLVYVYPIENIF